ncbi:hypothetical protein [Nocardia paucivorans]|nr:hypothetical protein [Nocardia paucivorans]
MTPTDTDRRTPRELFERGLDLLLAADAELEFPFATAGAPSH